MSFFQQLAELTEGINVTFRINTKDGTMTMLVLPDQIKNVEPLRLVGTADELDAGFFDAIRQPLTDTRQLLRNKDEYIQGLQTEVKAETTEAEGKAKKPAGKPAGKAVKTTSKGAPKDDEDDEDGSEEEPAKEDKPAKAKQEKKQPAKPKAAKPEKKAPAAKPEETPPPPPVGPVQLTIG